MTPPGGSSAGYRIYRLFPVSRRLEAERNALPIWVAYLPLTAVLLGDYPIKLECFAGIEVPRILPQMLTQEFAPQWADDWPVTNAAADVPRANRPRSRVENESMAYPMQTRRACHAAGDGATLGRPRWLRGGC